MSADELSPPSASAADAPAGSSVVGNTAVVIGLAVAASVALVAALWCVPYLPTNDGPNHIYLGYLENHFDDPARRYRDYLEYGRPVTSLGFGFLFSSLEHWLPWRDALRASLTIIALVWAWGYFGLVAAVDRRRLPLGLLGFAAALNWALYMGFFSYLLATGLSFAVLAFALRRPDWRPSDRVMLGALLLILSVVHVFAAQVSCLALLVLVIARKYGRRLWRDLAWWAAWTAAPAAVTLLTVDLSGLGGQLQSKESLGVERVLLLGAAFVSGPAWRSWPLVILALAGMGWATWQARRRQLQRDQIALLVTAALMLALALLLPIHVRGWEFLSPRFLPPAIMFGLLLLPVERLGPRYRAALLTAAGVFTFAAIGWAGTFHRDLYRRVAPALAGLDEPLHRVGPRLALVLEPYAGLPKHADWQQAAVPFIKPLLNLGQLYAVQQGGIPSWAFIDKPRVHSFVMSKRGRRHYPPVPDAVEIFQSPSLKDPASRRSLLSFLASVGSHFEDVILWGEPIDAAVLQQRGYSADVHQGGLLVARFEGCPVTVRIAAPSPPPHRLIIQCGWDPRYPLTSEYVVPAGTEPSDGHLSVPARRCLCGAVWYRVALDVDDSDSPSPADRYCDDAGPAGIRLVHVTNKPDNVMECRIPW